MDISSIEKHYHIKIQPSTVLVGSLISKIHAYEKRYSMRSSKVLYNLRTNKLAETEDICNWMHDYRVLKQLRNGKNGV